MEGIRVKAAKKVIEKTASVWDWKGKPSIMAKDNSLQRSQLGTQSRKKNDPLPPNMWIYKEKQ